MDILEVSGHRDKIGRTQHTMSSSSHSIKYQPCSLFWAAARLRSDDTGYITCHIYNIANDSVTTFAANKNVFYKLSTDL